jgi:hypothetical protein
MRPASTSRRSVKCSLVPIMNRVAVTPFATITPSSYFATESGTSPSE